MESSPAANQATLYSYILNINITFRIFSCLITGNIDIEKPHKDINISYIQIPIFLIYNTVLVLKDVSFCSGKAVATQGFLYLHRQRSSLKITSLLAESPFP